jgi:hypothetical protein
MHGKSFAHRSIDLFFSLVIDSYRNYFFPMFVVTCDTGEGTDPHGYMTAHAAMSSGVSAACDVLQTVITSRIKSVLPLQVTAFFLRECCISVFAARACV